MNDLYAQIQSAANAGATGLNGYAMPTPAQLQSGNYRKGRVKLYGLDIAIETPQGQRRTGKSDGKPWSVVCMAHYGEFSGTRGADNDPVDCYIGPSPESNRVFVVNQNGKDGAFDEHKVMLAFADEDAARAAYMGSYERGWTGLGSMVSATVEQFRWWLKHGNTALPFSKKALPYDGEDDMTDITWDSAGMPANSDLATILYGLRLGDSADGLLLDAVQMSDILEDADSLEILDALVVENAKLQPKMEQLQRIMESAGETVKPVALQVSEPFKQKGTTNVTALFELSDGQTVAIFFHNPDSTPNKILPQDELVSWKWLLNKMDVTILVAPEKGRDLNPREVARRIMRLAEKNSAKFQKANGARAERLAAIEQAKGAVAEKESTLASLDAEIADLTAKVEAKRANQAPDPSAPLGTSATELATGSGGVEPNASGSPAEITQADVLAALEPLGFERGASGGAFKQYGALENGAARHTVSARKIGGAVTGDPVEVLVATAANEVSQSTGRTVSAAPTIEERFATIAEAVAAIEAFEARLSPSGAENPASPGIFELAAAMKATSGTGAWWSDPSIEHVLRKAAELGYVARPSTSQIEWTAAGIAALNMAKASYGEDGKGLPKAPIDQRAAAVKAELAKLGWRVVKGSLPVHLELHGARYEVRPSVDAKAQTVTWKDTGGGPEWNDDLSLSDQAMAVKIDSEYRASIEEARAAAREPDLSSAKLVEGPELSALGMANIVSLGSENLYIEKDGQVYYTKDLEPDNYQLGSFDFFTITPAVLFAPDEITGANDRMLAQRRQSLGAYIQAANAANASVSDPILDEYQDIVSEEGRRRRGEALPEAANADPFPAEQMRDMRETADNFVIGSIISGGTPPTYDQIVARMQELLAAEGAEEATKRLAVTLNRSREEAKKALTFKAKDLYRDQIGSTANIKADAQIIGAVKSGGLDISGQEWASDFYRLFKIDQSKVGSVNADGLTEGAAAALKRFAAGKFEPEGASPEDYAAAAKAFLESNPSAPVPRGVRADWLDIVDVTNVQPTPIEKAIKEAKKPVDRFKVAYTTAGVNDNRYWLNGVHIDTDRGLVVSTDGHRAMVIEGLDLSMVPPKPDNGRQYSVLSAKGEWIEGKFPDWERVMPSRGSVPGMAKFTAKRVSAFARGAVKAGNYVRKTGHIAIPVQIGELLGFVSAEYMRDLAESFLKMGYAAFKMGMQKRDLSFYAESPDGQMRSIVLGLRVQKAEKLFAPLMPDGQEPEQAAPAPAPAATPEPAPADDDANIGRSWLNGYGETVSVESVRDGKYYTLLNGKVGGAPIIPVADLEQTIALDERLYQDKLERERAAVEEQAQEAAAKAEREDTDGFAEQFPQVQRDRIRATLAGNRNTPKGVMSLRDFVRALVADGRVMSEWDSERVLQDPATEGFYNAKDLTKTGLDYAAYLIARRPAAELADDQTQAARELLQSVIDGTADLDEGLTERLEAVHDQFQDNAEIMELFEQAANAFSDAMVAKAKAALA